MKTVTSILTLGLALSSLLAAQSRPPLKTIDLNKAKFHGPGCLSKWRDGYSHVTFLDDQHFAVFLLSSECSDAVANPKPAGEVAVFDSTGSVVAASHRDDLISIFRGPRGTLAALSWGNIELLDNQLRPIQSLVCPDESKSCGITLAPSSVLDSEFALCSAKDSQRICDFYHEWPTVTPRSSSNPRIWLIIAVRRITQRSRTLCSDCRSSCSSVLMGTKRMLGRVTASAIASASM